MEIVLDYKCNKEMNIWNCSQNKISVVIPSYNRGKSISVCLESIMNQTLPPNEVILVDDNSSDNTRDIILGLKYPNLKYIRFDQNYGAQAARNKGVYEASGSWIAFQDSDDEWIPEKLEMQMEALKSANCNPLTVVHTDCWLYESTIGEKKLNSIPLFNGENIYNELLISQGPMFPGILTSKMALEKIGFLDERVQSYQEWDTAIRLAKFCRFIHIQKPLFIYHHHADETISKNKRKSLEGYQYIVDKFRDDILFYCGEGIYNRHIVNNALKAMKWGYFEDAEEILDRCVGIHFGAMLLKLLNKNRIKPAIYERIVKWSHLSHSVHHRVARILRERS